VTVKEIVYIATSPARRPAANLLSVRGAQRKVAYTNHTVIAYAVWTRYRTPWNFLPPQLHVLSHDDNNSLQQPNHDAGDHHMPGITPQFKDLYGS
jgi:hypothetical protein